MASRDATLQMAANNVAERLMRKDAELKKRHDEIELELLQIDAERNLLGGTHERLLQFRPTLDGYVQCPQCWVRDGQRNALYSVPSRTGADTLRCDKCGIDLEVSY